MYMNDYKTMGRNENIQRIQMKNNNVKILIPKLKPQIILARFAINHDNVLYHHQTTHPPSTYSF